MTSSPWPPMLPVRHVRIARPTDRLDDVARFYRDGLALRDRVWLDIALGPA
jgi:hypothetical protein